MKGCGFADGRPQRIYTTKIESSSHMETLAGTMMTCVIDAYEGKDVATVDPPGAFLQTIIPCDTLGKDHRILSQDCTRGVSGIHTSQKGTVLLILQAQCGSVWDNKGSPPLLEQTDRKSETTKLCN